VDSKDTGERLAETTRRLEERAAAERAKLDEQWHAVQQTVQRMRPAGR
jgi:hypothetical protein